MHTHKFIFTYEGHAICEEPSCNYRFTLSEIKEILANIANEPAAEQNAHSDGACPHADTINPKGRVFCPDCRNLVPAPQVA